MIMDLVKNMLIKYPLCDSCLGRQFGGLLRGITNRERGRALKLALALEGHLKFLKEGNDELLRALAKNGNLQFAIKLLDLTNEDFKCYICEGIMENIENIAKEVIKALNNYEFTNFLIGIRVSGDIAEREDKLRSEFGIEYGESIRMECSREIGKEVSKFTGKNVEFKNPDIVVIVSIPSLNINVNPMPIYIFGRYRKLIRGIPQSKWYCSRCWGKGCEKCNWTGKKYPTSIEELIIEPILMATGGKRAKFHGAGREDIDAIVLGNGRPFIVEIKEPKKRAIDLKSLEETINKNAEGKVEVFELKYSNRKTVKRIKERSKIAEKTYRALVEVGREIPSEELEKLEKSFNSCNIYQYTPTRVLHRRADKLRIKKVYEMKVRKISDRMIELIVKCQGGLYVKELISGDNGRTRPSVAEILGTEAKCIELD
ncbi:MAG: tRNA pseudouridine(54/55) synthase Pus10, partial [Candidatus Methanomethyliaceae archaeon]|nr:tRNA pseudouridine(54/55) synthase Pus10 [Candidatus Methanomethyliaceae archaeon]